MNLYSLEYNSLELEGLYSTHLYTEDLCSENLYSQNSYLEDDLRTIKGVITPEEPKETFIVGPMDIPLGEASCARKFLSFISPDFLSKFDALIVKAILPAMRATERKESCKREKIVYVTNKTRNIQEFILKLDGGSSVNGVAIFLDESEKEDFLAGKAHDYPWIINFNGNAQFYEESLSIFQNFGWNQKVNVLLFNYRGVGDSEGVAASPADWVADGEACVRYLLSKGVPENRILINGYSLGGAIGTCTAALHRDIALINERSFGLLSKEAGALIKHLVEKDFEEIDRHCSGYLPTSSPTIAADLVEELFQKTDWELDVASAYEKITAPKLIVFHKQDIVMPYQISALYKVIKEAVKLRNPEAIDYSLHKGQWKRRLKQEFKPNRVKLLMDFDGASDAAHTYSIKNDKAYRKVREFIQTFVLGRQKINTVEI